MTTKLLLVAYPVAAVRNEKQKTKGITRYGAALYDLTRGNPSKQIAAPTDDQVKREFEEASKGFR